jgi:thymidine kinase
MEREKRAKEQDFEEYCVSVALAYTKQNFTSENLKRLQEILELAEKITELKIEICKKTQKLLNKFGERRAGTQLRMGRGTSPPTAGR